MNAEDFQDLYKLLRGSRSAFAILDARTLYLEKQMRVCLEKVQEAREAYKQSRSRLMKQDAKKEVDPKAKDADRQIKRIERKQEKVREILEKFDELLPALIKLANREKPAAEPKQVAEDVDDTLQEFDTRAEVAVEGFRNLGADDPEDLDVERPATPADITPQFIAAFIHHDGDDQLTLISQHFGFRAVEDEEDIYANAVYFIRVQDESFLVHTPVESEMGDGVPLLNAIDDIPMKNYSREAFIRLGTRRRMVLLTSLKLPNPTAADVVTTPDVDPSLSSDTSNEPNSREPTSDNLEADPEASKILDMGAFSQLMDSAQRSGLVPGADRIAHFRDREFRLGRYDMAFAGIEGIYAGFIAASGQRTQRLAREEADIKSGKLKISPKELLAKRAKDRRDDQEVERARNRFQRVLNGLSVLVSSGTDSDNTDSNSEPSNDTV